MLKSMTARETLVTVRVSRRIRDVLVPFTAGIVAVTLFMALHIDRALVRPGDGLISAVLGAIAVTIFAFFWLQYFYVRLVADLEALVGYDFLNRPSVPILFSSLTEYRYEDRYAWRLFAGSEEIKLPYIELTELHRVLVERAPQVLRAKRWKGGRIAPAREYRFLWMCEANDWFAFSVLIAVLFIPAVVLFHVSWAAPVGAFIGGRLQNATDFFGKLTMNDDGVSAVWPWERHDIAWKDVTAIFQEGEIGTWRRFVLTSKDATIIIPRHIARDLDVMRKVFYSLPAGALCVNFDENVMRGYRRRGRRKKIRLGVPQAEPSLSPAF